MQERDTRIDYARATAVLLMILQHVCIFLHAQNIKVTYVSAMIVEIIILITKSAVPLFVIITGSVLLNDEKNFSYKKGIKLSLNMVKIIATWNVINAIYFAFNSGIKVGLGKLVYGNYWYLYMLVALYLLMPIVNLMIKNYNETKIITYIIAITLVYELWLSYSLVMPVPIYKYALRFVDKFQFSLITGYTGLLLLGFLIRKESANIKLDGLKVRRLGLIFVTLMLGLLIYAMHVAVKNNEYNYIYFDEFTAVVLGGTIFYIFQTLNFHKNGWVEKIFLFIGTHSLGMYVVSNLFLDIYKRVLVSIEIFPNIVIGIATCGIMIIVPSCIVVWLISKTPLNKIV